MLKNNYVNNSFIKRIEHNLRKKRKKSLIEVIVYDDIQSLDESNIQEIIRAVVNYIKGNEELDQILKKNNIHPVDVNELMKEIEKGKEENKKTKQKDDDHERYEPRKDKDLKTKIC
ncbi:MAG: hypothetical protein ACTSVV_14380, partial [Promethearchaeota archaeon]